MWSVIFWMCFTLCFMDFSQLFSHEPPKIITPEDIQQLEHEIKHIQKQLTDVKRRVHILRGQLSYNPLRKEASSPTETKD